MNINAAIAAGAGETFNADVLTPFRTQVGASLPGLTIMRTRLQWSANDGTGNGRMILAGLRVFTSSPDAPGSLLDVDGPASDPHADWMMFDSYQLPLSIDTGWFHQRDVDVKAMRRLDEVSDSLVLSFQVPSEQQASLKYMISVLVALP